MKNKDEILMDMIESKDFDQLNSVEKALVNSVSDEKAYTQMRQLFLELSEHKLEFEDSGKNVLFIEAPKGKKSFFLGANLWKAAAIFAIACNMIFFYMYYHQKKLLANEITKKVRPIDIKPLKDTIYKIVYQSIPQDLKDKQIHQKPTHKQANSNKEKFKLTIDNDVKSKVVGMSINNELNILNSVAYETLTSTKANNSMANDTLMSRFAFVTFD